MSHDLSVMWSHSVLWLVSQPIPYRYYTVYVESTLDTKPFCSLEEANFPGSVCAMLTRLGFQTPSLIQGCSWPIVGQDHLTVLVSPPLSGKTLAYLLPLVTRRELVRSVDSSECVPQPRLMVLVASSWGAQAVFTRARDLVSALSASRRFRWVWSFLSPSFSFPFSPSSHPHSLPPSLSFNPPSFPLFPHKPKHLT